MKTHDKLAGSSLPAQLMSATTPFACDITTLASVHFITMRISELVLLHIWAGIDLALNSRGNFFTCLPYFRMVAVAISRFQDVLDLPPQLTFLGVSGAKNNGCRIVHAHGSHVARGSRYYKSHTTTGPELATFDVTARASGMGYGILVPPLLCMLHPLGVLLDF